MMPPSYLADTEGFEEARAQRRRRHLWKLFVIATLCCIGLVGFSALTWRLGPWAMPESPMARHAINALAAIWGASFVILAVWFSVEMRRSDRWR